MRLRQFVERRPELKNFLKALARPFRQESSSGYAEFDPLTRADRVAALSMAWQAKDIPIKQRVGVDRSLASYRLGEPIREFDVLIELLRRYPARASASNLRLLEVGCSSGYYSEALALRGVKCIYAGCDYSPEFIGMARRLYPALDFEVEDATALSYADSTFDIVVSGCCILHIPDYAAAITEAARVARHQVVFHRTPVLHLAPTKYFSKLAYGIETVEIHFNEEELVSLFARHGLRVLAIATINASWRDGDAFATKTYLCEKK